jgi:hypothetical protein
VEQQLKAKEAFEENLRRAAETKAQLVNLFPFTFIFLDFE